MRLRRLFFVIALLGASCDQGEKIEALEKRIDELETKQKAHAESLEPLAALPEDVKKASAKADDVAARASEAAAAATLLDQRVGALELQAKQIEDVLANATATPPSKVEPTEGVIGVPECDEYLTKYRRCIEDHAPEAVRKSLEDALDKTEEAWKHVADGPGKEALAQACTTAQDAMKKAAGAWGCEF